MKTKLMLIFTAIALAGMTGVSKASDQRMIYNGKGQLIAVAPDPSDVGTSTSNDAVKYVPGFNSKGGITLVPSREPTTSIALFKAKKATSCDTCSAKH